MDVTIGSTRFWCRETPQYAVGVSARVAVIAGFPSTWIWSVPDGALLAVWGARPLGRDVIALDLDGETLVVDTATHRRRYDLQNGALRSEEAPVSHARIALDASRAEVTVTLPDGEVKRHAIPWSASVTVARDGARFATSDARATRVYDTRDGALVFTCPRASGPTLSADGATLMTSLFGPPRAQLYDVDARRRVGPDEPPHVGEVMLGDGVAVIDDAAWSLDDAREFAPLEGVGGPLRIVGDTLVARGDRSLGRWNLRTGERTRSIELGGDAECASVDGSGRFVVLTRYITQGLLYVPLPGVTLVDVETAETRSLGDVADDVTRSVAIAPDASVIAIAGDDTVRELDREGRPIRAALALTGASAVMYSGDSATLAVRCGHADSARQGVTLVEAGVAYVTLLCARDEVIGWWRDDLLRLTGERYERVDRRTLEVVGAWSPEASSREVWLGDRLVAESSGDGTLRVRDLVWT